jgi:hypothetical protein
VVQATPGGVGRATGGNDPPNGGSLTSSPSGDPERLGGRGRRPVLTGVPGGSAAAAVADGTAGAAIVAAASASSAITCALGGRPPRPERT